IASNALPWGHPLSVPTQSGMAHGVIRSAIELVTTSPMRPRSSTELNCNWLQFSRIDIRLEGCGLRDLVLTNPYAIEVAEPDDIELPPWQTQPGEEELPRPEPDPPEDSAPTVCVMDSGIQEQHQLVEPAIDCANSHCYLRGRETDIADYVAPGGHGARVAGAILDGETVSRTGTFERPCWIQNARVLGDDGKPPNALFPPALLKAIVDKYHKGERKTRLFNHSIYATSLCRMRHMSACATEIDLLTHEYDILFIRSAGNVQSTSAAPNTGIQEHLP
ncbi:MAG: S8 family serine peptidase, partial [Planctomycetales bacterium]|nr:S8 family serine peptidase [Planctomycetales bacterium]